MELQTLRVFMRVSELGSFSKAATSLGMTQPTISRVIGELEREFAGQLFYRTGRGVSLTEKGEMLFPRVQALLQTAEQICNDSLAFEETPVGLVCIGAYPSLMRTLSPALFADVRARAPGVRLRFIEGFSDQIERGIGEGSIDIGLVSKYRTFRPGHDDVLMRANLLLVRSPETPSLGDPVDFSALATVPLVLPSMPNGLRVLLEEAARRHKMKLNVVAEADSHAAQREIVRECGCYSILAAQALMDPESALIGSPISGAEFVRYLVVVTTVQRPLSKASRVVLNAIRRVVPVDES